MADMPTVKTKRLTRNKLAEVFKNHEMVKAFENLQQDVDETLPEAIAESSSDADSVLAADVFRPRVPLTPPTDNGASDDILSMAAFLPRQPAMPPQDDEASKIISTQIFGA